MESVQKNQTLKNENLNLSIQPLLDNSKWKKRMLVTFKVMIAVMMVSFLCGMIGSEVVFFMTFFVSLLIMCLGSIFLIVWFYREYCNLHKIVSCARFKKAWAIWGWLLPFFSLFRPYQIMKELYSECVKESGKKEDELAVWWTFWIILNCFSSGIDKISERCAVVSDAYCGLLLVMLLDAVLLVRIVRKIDVKVIKE